MLDAPGLVREAYLRIARQECLPGRDRNAFLAYASRTMRSVIIDYLRSRSAARNGDGAMASALIAAGADVDYVEPQFEIASQFSWQRYEFYVQDTWSVTPRLRLDLGLRYSLQPGFVDANDLLTNFVPGNFVAANAPRAATIRRATA